MSALPARDLFARLGRWVEAGALRPLDLALTRFVHEQGPEADPAVLLAVALASERNGHGHVCLDLREAIAHPDELLTRLPEDTQLASSTRAELGEALAGLSAADWAERLTLSPAVDPSAHTGLPALSEPRAGAAPLVLGGSAERPLLYLRRYWDYESQIREGVQMRLRRPLDLPEGELRDLLGLVFANSPEADPWQRIACALAARSPFAIITGGPGTGKTTTVVRLLAVLQGLALRRGEPPLRIRLAAPTGKAAARLNESIAGRVAGLPFDRLPQGDVLRGAIPTQVVTLHRLLGPIPDSRHFRHHPANPLPADLVVVDEASMVDVEMMASLLGALRPDARLILLGDKDQLASVEAGAVLGDLCQRARAAHYRPETSAWLQRVTGEAIERELIDRDGRPLDQCITMLRTSFRFNPEGGIGALAELVNEGVLDRQVVMDRFGAFLQLLQRRRKRGRESLGRIEALRLSGPGDESLDGLMAAGYGQYLSVMEAQVPGGAVDQAGLDAWARAVLEAYGRFQVLTAQRQGPWGVEGLNARALGVLGDRLAALASVMGPLGDRPRGPTQWFAGRPVLVTRNDYGLNLMNGDIGMAFPVPVGGDASGTRWALRVAFPTGDGRDGIRWVLPSRLQAVETVFAMTVHKSQGSELRHTVLVLPDAPNPVLTRELLYTAITRSKEVFTLAYGEESVLRVALERQVRRMSGLSLHAGSGRGD